MLDALLRTTNLALIHDCTHFSYGHLIPEGNMFMPMHLQLFATILWQQSLVLEKMKTKLQGKKSTSPNFEKMLEVEKKKSRKRPRAGDVEVISAPDALGKY